MYPRRKINDQLNSPDMYTVYELCKQMNIKTTRAETGDISLKLLCEGRDWRTY